MRLFEFDESSTKIPKLNEFVKWVCKKIGAKDCPTIKYGTSLDKVKKLRTFGSTTSNGDIWVHIENRNLADIMRTLCHEIIHFKQFGTGSASDGMDDKQRQRIEDEANAYAGRLMRDYGKIHKDIYESVDVKNAENDAAFIGYLSPNGKFECYPESEAQEADYHHSHLVQDLDAYDAEGGLTFVRYGSEPIITIKGTPAIDPYDPKSSLMISNLARKIIQSGGNSDMPIKIDNMGFGRMEAPYQDKIIGTLREWSLRNEPKRTNKG